MPDDPALAGLDWEHSALLPDYRNAAPTLDLADQLAVLDQAADTLAAHYAHLPQKRQTRGVDPVATLRSWRDTLAGGPALPAPALPAPALPAPALPAPALPAPALPAPALPAPALPALDFHTRLCLVFADLHDLHTLYTLPPYFAAATAFLPFTAARIGRAGEHILVSHVLPRFADPHFHPGVELLTWNGEPIRQTLQALETVSGGANPAASRARALQMLTQRPLLRMPPPASDQVVIGFRTADDAAPRAITLPWRVSTAPASPHPVSHRTALRSSLDSEGDALHGHRRRQYGRHAGRLHGAAVGLAHPYRHEIPSLLADVHAWAGESGGRRFGVLRIQSFKTDDDDAFLAGVQALLAALPQNGLVLDVRDNPGGLVAAAERLLQCFSQTAIRPVNVAFLATPANLALCQTNTPAAGNPVLLDLSAWVAPLQQALAQGEAWSQALPMTAPENFGPGLRAYPGPVVLLTSGCCYSACDIFIAGFRDNRLGPILGVDENIGAGGANMWKRSQIELLRTGTPAVLPGDADLHVAVRRVFRVDPAATPLEEIGIPPDHLHHRTRRDVLEQDTDLFTIAVSLLPGGDAAPRHPA